MTNLPHDRDAADPASVLSDLARLRRTARRARHAYAVPLLMVGALTLAAGPLYLDHGVQSPTRAYRRAGAAGIVIGPFLGLVADSLLQRTGTGIANAIGPVVRPLSTLVNLGLAPLLLIAGGSSSWPGWNAARCSR